MKRPTRIQFDVSPDVLLAMQRLETAVGLTVSEIAKAAFISKFAEYANYGHMSFGPGVKQKP